jgi:hypothetical protein
MIIPIICLAFSIEQEVINTHQKENENIRLSKKYEESVKAGKLDDAERALALLESTLGDGRETLHHPRAVIELRRKDYAGAFKHLRNFYSSSGQPARRTGLDPHGALWFWYLTSQYESTAKADLIKNYILKNPIQIAGSNENFDPTKISPSPLAQMYVFAACESYSVGHWFRFRRYYELSKIVDSRIKLPSKMVIEYGYALGDTPSALKEEAGLLTPLFDHRVFLKDTKRKAKPVSAQ